MAKTWRVSNVSCERDFAWNARRILATRVAEVYSHAPSLGEPRDAKGHHDLRISIKRLRYSLEFFAVCYDPAEVADLLSQLSTMQDYLGDLHDADVFIPELQRAADDLDAERERALLAAAGARDRGEARPYEEFATAVGRAARRDARPGILGVINRLRAQRRERYAAAAELWARLEGEGFRERLARLGEPPPAGEPEGGPLAGGADAGEPAPV